MPDRALIVVTHDSRIFEFADRIARMEDGKIVVAGITRVEPEAFDGPAAGIRARLVPDDAVVVGDTDLMALTDEEMRQARLSRIAYIPQGAMNSLNPVQTVQRSIADGLADHGVRERRDIVTYDQRGNLLAIEGSQLRQATDEREEIDGADTGNGIE